MKINLIDRDYPKVFLKSSGLLLNMNYVILFEDINLGIISAFKIDFRTGIIDLRFKTEGGNTSITVFPGLLSSDFENISYDECTAQIFVESLIRSFKMENDLNSFRLMEEDYLAVIPV